MLRSLWVCRSINPGVTIRPCSRSPARRGRHRTFPRRGPCRRRGPHRQPRPVRPSRRRSCRPAREPRRRRPGRGRPADQQPAQARQQRIRRLAASQGRLAAAVVVRDLFEARLLAGEFIEVLPMKTKDRRHTRSGSRRESAKILAPAARNLKRLAPPATRLPPPRTAGYWAKGGHDGAAGPRVERSGGSTAEPRELCRDQRLSRLLSREPMW